MRLNEVTSPPDPLVKFDDRWDAFIRHLSTLPPGATLKQAIDGTDVPAKLASLAVDRSMDEWRSSPSGSMFHSLVSLHPGQAPQPGAPIFPDLMWQTRFLVKARDHDLIDGLNLTVIRGDDEKPIKVRGTLALTTRFEGETATNKVVRALYAYWFLNHRKQVKLPKSIYRGVRASNLYNHPTFEAAVAAIWAQDREGKMKRKDVIDVLIRWICDRKLHQFTDGMLLSFTSSIPVANYFANGEGFILRVDPSKVSIITSELHDEVLAEPDFVSGKREREFIVRIPADYDFKPADIIMHDLDYFVAENNPLSVALFDHDDKEATYTMNGVPIEAFAAWNYSGDSLKRLFKRVDQDGYSQGRAEFKKQHGFDPMPTPQNLHLVADFKIRPRKNRW